MGKGNICRIVIQMDKKENERMEKEAEKKTINSSKRGTMMHRRN